MTGWHPKPSAASTKSGLARAGSLRSLRRLLWASVAAIVLGLLAWWAVDSEPGQPGQNSPPLANAGSPAASTPAPALATASDVVPESWGAFQPDAKPPGKGSSAGSARLKPPPGDLGAAFEHARGTRTAAAPSAPPGGQSSWHGMAPNDAARVFEAAVHAASSASAAINPFSHE
jgi:hypothetical protein